MDRYNILIITDPLSVMVEGYTWVPPGLSPSRVEEYMRQIPVEKVPKVGSVGERYVMSTYLATINSDTDTFSRYRDRQLNLQLPKQDLSTKYCTHLEQQHQVGKVILILFIQPSCPGKLLCICLCS